MSGLTAKAPHGETVFVVDDMKTIRELVSAQLEQLDCAPEAFASGEECIHGLSQREPRLILMDLGMGPMRGDECCRRIKENERTSHIPIVMLTGTDAAHEVMHSWRAGADDFLPKPIRRPQLASKIEAIRKWDPATPFAQESVSRHRVLLLENRAFYRSRLGGALEHAGFQILYCKNAAEALHLLNVHRDEVDLLICDLGSMLGDGMEQARQLREHASARSALLLTSASPPAPEADASSRQLTGYEILNKRSIPTEVILAKVNAVLRREAIDIRAAERVPFFSVVEFRGGPSDEWLSGFAYDISTRGIFIRTMTTFPALSKIEMKVRFFAARADIVCDGVVAWANPFKPRSSFSNPLGMGVGFERLDPESEKMIVKLVESGGRASSIV